MEEKRRVLNSLFFPVSFLVLIWFVKFFEISMEINFIHAGVMPRKLSGLQGILFSPLIHSDWKHLFDNSIPVFLLSFALFYFYRGISCSGSSAGMPTISAQAGSFTASHPFSF